jgi:transposase
MVIHADRGVRRYCRTRRPGVEGDAKKTRIQVYRCGEDWYCSFNIEYDADTSGEMPISVDIGEQHIPAVTAYSEGESMLVSAGEALCARCAFGVSPLTTRWVS